MSAPDPSAAPTPPAGGSTAAPPPAGKSPRKPDRGRLDIRFWLGLAIGLLVLAYLIGLIVDNTRRVRVGYVFGHSEASLVWIVVIGAIAGFLLGVATVLLYQRHRRQARAAKKR